MALLCCLGFCSDLLINTELWDNGTFRAKSNHLLKSKGKHDVLFFGSSQVHRHIIPSVFDSLNGTNSFNFGINAMQGTEKILIFKELLRKGYFDGIDYVVLDMGMYIDLEAMSERIDKDRGRLFFSTRSLYDHLSFLFSVSTDVWVTIERSVSIFRYYLKSRLKLFVLKAWIWPVNGKNVSSVKNNGFKGLIDSKYKNIDVHNREVSLLKNSYLANETMALKVPPQLQAKYSS